MGSPLPLRALLSHADEYGAAVRNAMPKKVIVAYHGSPHSFDAFDASKIGTGEGAQAYGYGLYFAGNEAVAKSYRDIAPAVLSPEQQESAKRIVAEYHGAVQEQRAIADAIARLHERKGALSPGWGDVRAAPPGDPELAELLARQKLMQARVDEIAANASAAISARGIKPDRGHMYEVEIGYPEESLLDWDKPVLSQPAAVRSAMIGLGAVPDIATQSRWRGGDAYQKLVTRIAHDPLLPTHGRATPEIATIRMMDAGIPGIRYLDQGSRFAGEGTRNYVMFPGTEDRIRILRKYGLLGPAAVAGTNSEE